MRLLPTRSPTTQGLVQELEETARRARLLLLAAPALLIGGFGAGHVVKDELRVARAGVVTERAAEHHIRIDALQRTLRRVREAGDETTGYVTMYRTEIAPVESALRRRGVPAVTARRVAWPLVRQARENGLETATVLSVLLLESAGRPDATSTVGARGLMQIMPSWAGYWRACGRNLYDIEANLCSGTRILAWYLKRFGGDERRALLGYNGCVRGTNTPNCGSYPDRVASLRRELRRELAAARSRAALSAD